MWYVHVNQHIIRANIASEVKQPPILVKKGKNGQSQGAFEVSIPAGSRLRSNPDGSPILGCGARVVLECDTAPRIIR